MHIQSVSVGATVPLIGITCADSRNLPANAKYYAEGVERAGGKAVFISPDTGVDEVAAGFDGIVIPGGRDLPPASYGEEPIFECRQEDMARTEFEYRVLREIMKIRKPVLGICYGMQLLNVFLGGTLYQDIGSQIAGSIVHREGVHEARIQENPLLQSGVFGVNSSHHQAVKRPGTGIVPFAFAPDGVVEAVLLAGYPFMLGIQWHPERAWDVLSSRIFSRFLAACRAE